MYAHAYEYGKYGYMMPVIIYMRMPVLQAMGKALNEHLQEEPNDYIYARAIAGLRKSLRQYMQEGDT